jgi:hypothetical protein
MRNRFRDPIIVLATAIVVATLSFEIRKGGGRVAVAAESAPGRTADGKPDLGGIWQALNTANWDLQTHAARPALAVMPGPGGEVPAPPVLALGAMGGVPGGVGVVEGEEIPYKPDAVEKKKANFADILSRDPETKCYLPGVPRASYLPYPFQIVQGTGKIMMIFEYAGANRTIHMDKITPSPVESWMGFSVGHWEGDTLVVDTTSLQEDTWFDRAGNFHSDELHVVERLTPLTPYHLTYEATIEDPKVFTRPWKISMPLYRHMEKNARLMEYNCVQFVEELMYGHLRKQQLAKRWEEDLGETGGKLAFDVSRQR